MSPANDEGRRQAIDWAIRTDDPDFSDWTALEAWLEADRRHAEWYDLATLGASEAAESLRAAPSAEILAFRTPVTASRTRPAWRPFAIAASVMVAAFAALFLLIGREAAAPMQIAATAPGEVRQLALSDGTRIDLNGATRVAWSPDRREAELLAGEALFTVVHHDESPFRVKVGAATVTDVGTSFDLALADGAARVAVSHGTVDVAATHGKARLEQGDGMDIAPEGTLGPRRRVVAETVGTWRTQRLFYDDERLDHIVADVTRRTGIPITLDPRVANRRFAGTIDLTGERAAIVARTASVLGLTAEHRGNGTWRLTR